jgi:hypothetical protein
MRLSTAHGREGCGAGRADEPRAVATLWCASVCATAKAPALLSPGYLPVPRAMSIAVRGAWRELREGPSGQSAWSSRAGRRGGRVLAALLALAHAALLLEVRGRAAGGARLLVDHQVLPRVVARRARAAGLGEEVDARRHERHACGHRWGREGVARDAGCGRRER